MKTLFEGQQTVILTREGPVHNFSYILFQLQCIVMLILRLLLLRLKIIESHSHLDYLVSVLTLLRTKKVFNLFTKNEFINLS